MNSEPLLTNVATAKLVAVTSLVEKLTQDLDSINLLPHRKKKETNPEHAIMVTDTRDPTERDAALEELKIYGRDPRNADPIFAKEVGLNPVR